jgi:hypothetical protein
MKANEGSVDRAIRMVLGLVLLGVAFAVLGIGTVGGVIAAVVGAVLVTTGLVGFCPAYAVFGFTTCPLAR